MSRFVFALVLCALCLAVVPAIAAAADTPETAPAAAVAPPAAATEPATLATAIADALALERTRIETLAAQLAAAPDDAAALELQRGIEQAKFEAQVRVLALQADFARREGRVDDAARIQAALDAMGRAPTPVRGEERSVPADAPTGR